MRVNHKLQFMYDHDNYGHWEMENAGLEDDGASIGLEKLQDLAKSRCAYTAFRSVMSIVLPATIFDLSSSSPALSIVLQLWRMEPTV